MKVRFLRPEDIPRMRPILAAEVETLHEALAPSVEACERFLESLLRADTQGFGLVCLNEAGAIAGVFVGRVTILPGTDRPVVTDVFYSAPEPGAMNELVNEVEHLATLWGCAGFTLSMNSVDPEVVIRWGRRWGARPMSTCLLKEL